MKPLSFVIIIFVPVIIILFSFMTVVLDDSFFYNQFKENNVYYSVPDADYVYYNLSNYLVKGGPLDQSYYTDREVKHLDDVKGLIGMASYTLVILLLISMGITAYFFVGKEYKTLGVAYLIGGAFAFAISVVFSVSAIASFNDFFVIFHKVLFSNDFWKLPASTMLIRLFPEQFFVAASRRIMASCLLLSAFSVGKGLVLILVRERL